MKKNYIVSFMFMLIMSVGMYISYHIYGIKYASPQFTHALLPMFFVLVPFALITYFKYKKSLGDHSPKYLFFMLVFVPVVLMGIFAVFKNFELSKSFFIPLIVAFFVGISEELIYRGIIFTNAAKEKGVFKGILISALFFSLAHSINVIGGLTVFSMFIQLINTFFSGIFYAGVYRYTKNITLLIVIHALWDYVLLTNVQMEFPFLVYVFTGLIILEIIIGIGLLIKYKNELK